MDTSEDNTDSKESAILSDEENRESKTSSEAVQLSSDTISEKLEATVEDTVADIEEVATDTEDKITEKLDVEAVDVSKLVDDKDDSSLLDVAKAAVVAAGAGVAAKIGADLSDKKETKVQDEKADAQKHKETIDHEVDDIGITRSRRTVRRFRK